MNHHPLRSRHSGHRGVFIFPRAGGDARGKGLNRFAVGRSKAYKHRVIEVTGSLARRA